MRIGIDIGGTHTDGVLIDGSRLLAAAKAPTNTTTCWSRSARSCTPCSPARMHCGCRP